ncbi:MAG: twin-arginine translocase TatA/TatE family subunit [Bacillota bacterium]
MFGFMPIGPWEIALILAIVLIIFGPGKLPQLGKMFGRALGEFKSSVKDVEDSVKDVKDSVKDVKDSIKLVDTEESKKSNTP